MRTLRQRNKQREWNRSKRARIGGKGNRRVRRTRKQGMEC